MESFAQCLDFFLRFIVFNGFFSPYLFSFIYKVKDIYVFFELEQLCLSKMLSFFIIMSSSC